MTGYDRDFRLSVAAADPVALAHEGAPGDTATVPANQTLGQRLYLTSAPGSAAAATAAMPIEAHRHRRRAAAARPARRSVFHGKQ